MSSPPPPSGLSTTPPAATITNPPPAETPQHEPHTTAITPSPSLQPKTNKQPLETDTEKGSPEIHPLPSPPPCGSSKSGSSKSALSSLPLLDRLLAVWIFLAMLIGILLGNFVPSVGPALQRGTFVSVSVPIAVGLLVMMYPILCKVQYETLPRVFRSREVWHQLGFSLVVNWIVAPFIMLALSWAFLPDKPDLRQGLILVGVARCIAMVLIWTNLAGGDNDYCAILVAFNSLLQIVLFAPVALLLTQVIAPHNSTASAVHISYSTVATSVAVFLGIPLAAAVLTRFTLLRLTGPRFYNTTFIPFLAPWSLIGLLFTILVLFASQGARVVEQIVSVVRVAAPLIVYFALIFFATLLVCMRWCRFRYELALTQSFTAASNNFELAIAVAVAAFGADSDQALAATVGPLIEVPVLLGLVYGVGWFARRRGWKE